MPNYDYRCSECGKEWEAFHHISTRHQEFCKVCGKEARLVVKGSNIEVFKPMWYEDIDVEPIYITSKKQLKRECDKRNLKAARLM